MGKYTVLICDDNEAVHESLKLFLEEEDIQVVSVYCGKDFRSALEHQKIDLIVLDIMLPDSSGTVLCWEARKHSNIPVIMLSAKSEEADRITGLELGADDYVTKPFSPREVSIRIQKLLSRSEPSNLRMPILRFRELSLNQETFEVFVGDERVDLSAKEIRLLAYLMINSKKVLSREQILDAVWDYDCYCDTRAVDAVIKRLRQKLPSKGVHFSIQSIYGAGYRLGESSEG